MPDETVVIKLDHKWEMHLPLPVTSSSFSPTLCEQTVSAWRRGASAPFAQNQADLRIHQQRYDERNVERGHRRVHHKGRVCKAARGAFSVS